MLDAAGGKDGGDLVQPGAGEKTQVDKEEQKGQHQLGQGQRQQGGHGEPVLQPLVAEDVGECPDIAHQQAAQVVGVLRQLHAEGHGQEKADVDAPQVAVEQGDGGEQGSDQGEGHAADGGGHEGTAAGHGAHPSR